MVQVIVAKASAEYKELVLGENDDCITLMYKRSEYTGIQSYVYKKSDNSLLVNGKLGMTNDYIDMKKLISDLMNQKNNVLLENKGAGKWAI